MFRIGTFELTPAEITRRKEYLELRPADEQRLRDAHAHLQNHAEGIIDRFYEYLLGHEHTRAMLSAPGLVDRLKKLQTKYFSELTAGEYELPYFESRLRIGQVHQRIGLAPEWYLGAYAKYLHIATDVLSSAFGRDYEKFFQTLISLTKVISLDQGLAIDAYHFASQEALESKNVALEKSNEEQERLQAAKRQLTDMIVHDLQNPLTGVRSALQVMQENETKLSASAKKAMEAAIRRCDDLFDMVMNVLSVSRAESGELATYIENINLGSISREVVEAFRPAADLEKRAIKVEGPAKLELRSDQNLVRRILQNLLRNAIRHTPRETQVRVLLEKTKKGGGAMITVVDHGHGIPVELQANIFEPFGATALRTAGIRVDSGLGLPSCRIMARAIGADVTVANAKPRGAAFTLRLPASAPEAR